MTERGLNTQIGDLENTLGVGGGGFQVEVNAKREVGAIVSERNSVSDSYSG